MKPPLKPILYLLLLNMMFVAVLFIVGHAWYMARLEPKMVKELYPRFHSLLILTGQNSVWIFIVISITAILSNAFGIFKIITLQHDKKTSALFFVSVVVTLLLAETGLRSAGFKPGYKNVPVFFNKVDTLIEYEEYLWDERGILHFSKEHSEKINSLIQSAQQLSSSESLDSFLSANNNFDYCSWLLLNDFGALYEKDIKAHHFEKYLTKIQRIDLWDDVDSAVSRYASNPINNMGFKSIDFKNYNSSKIKVLLIGDSFTYGMSAKPVYASFADILLTKGYAVFNPSFPTNDPENYFQIAQKYITELNPDIAIVNFYMGNDIMTSNRISKPYQKHFFPTNASWIQGEINGEYFKNAISAYEFFYKMTFVNENNFYGNLLSSTVLTTMFYTVLEKYLGFRFEDDKTIIGGESKLILPPNPELSEERLIQIGNLCHESDIEYIVAVIPDKPGLNKSVRHFNLETMFREQKVHVIKNVSIEDYVLKKTDGHFNNSGHSKYADFLDSLIQVHAKIN